MSRDWTTGISTMLVARMAKAAATISPKFGSKAEAAVPTMKIITSARSSRVRDIRTDATAKIGARPPPPGRAR